MPSYGSVTGSDVAEALEKEGFEIDKRRILLEEPIKSVGIYTVPVRLHPEVTAEVKVGDIRRSVEAVVDRSEPTEPRLLSWRVL